MKKVMAWVLYCLLGLIIFALLYLAADALLSRISLNKVDQSSGQKTIEAYILSNGVHTDIVLPIRTADLDWTSVFPIENTKGKAQDHQFISIGWGDKGFYLNTPEWKDLTAKTALVAALGIGETALHITYYKQMENDSLCRKINIDSTQLSILQNYIINSLDKDQDGKPIYIQTNAQYGQDDAFYEAKGAYSMFYSCNTWTNEALKKAHMPAGYWTVFDKGILRHYSY
ncbi:TIGR02117 family protein [Sphingobacterium lactis]|uniref:TIGR02117 family protein n=1 Tax=Sphingobacterium lactis TaxID=797291 RepID=UPI003F820527